MPVPPEIRKKLLAKATAAFEAALDEAWGAAVSATYREASEFLQQAIVRNQPNPAHAPEPVNPTVPTAGTLQGRLIYDHPTSVAAGMGTMSPQKRGAQNREKKGVVKGTIRTIIDNSPEGISRGKIREVAQTLFGLTIKDGSLKQGLRLLKADRKIENRDQLWFPTKDGGQSND